MAKGVVTGIIGVIFGIIVLLIPINTSDMSLVVLYWIGKISLCCLLVAIWVVLNPAIIYPEDFSPFE